MKGKIAKRAVDALAPNALLWDDEVRGFAVRRRTADGAVYLVKYRTANGRQRWARIGRHGSPWTADAARAEAKQILAAVARGGDPAGARQRARAAVTMNALFDRFADEHVPKLKPTTAKEYRRLIAATLRPALGAHAIADVTGDDVARLHQKLKATPILANRAVVVLAKILALGERWQMRAPGTNPARGIEKYRERRRTRRLSLDEVTRLGAAFADAERGVLQVPNPDGTTSLTRISPFALAAIKLLLFTGARKSEILGATWAEVDLERAVLEKRDSKTGAKIIPLAAPAVALLSTLPRIEDCPYVIASTVRAGRPIVNLSKPLAAILAAAQLEGVTLHVLRHSFGSVAADEGLSLPIIGSLLGHAHPTTTAIYTHVASPIRDASELVAGKLAAAIAGGR